MSEIRAILITETEKARLVRVAGQEIWIPKSLTRTITKFAPDLNGHREVVMDVADWFLDKHDL